MNKGFFLYNLKKKKFKLNTFFEKNDLIPIFKKKWRKLLAGA